MTEDFAINILEQYKEKPTLINEIETIEEAAWLDEALDMAIVAIKALKQKLCDDAISRQAVLDLIADYDLSMGQVVRGIHALPSVTPQEPKKIGQWIDADGDNAICGRCNRLNHLYGTYCKHCGAKMIKKE